MSAERIRPGSAARRKAGDAAAGAGAGSAGARGAAADLPDWAPGASPEPPVEGPVEEEADGVVLGETATATEPVAIDSQSAGDDATLDDEVFDEQGTGEDLDEDVPVALPTTGPATLGGALANFTPTGPRFEDEPLRPEEFVSIEAAVEVLGPDALSRTPKRTGDEAGEPDDVEEVITAQDLAVAPGAREGFWHRLYYGRTRFDFVRRRRIWFSFSLALIVAGGISLAAQGLNLGIDFAGGTAWTVPSSTLSIATARNAISPLGYGGATITQLGHGSNQTLQVQAKLGSGKNATNQSAKEVAKVTDALAKAAHLNAQAIGVNSVGPSWGSSVTNKAVQALIVFFILVSLYISIFFEWRMALAAVIAVAHDVLVVVGIYSLSRFEVTPDTVVAILTILGYSLYDTIVVFDRVRDNVKGIAGTGRITISDIVNLSMNQTLARSINTSLVAILPILAVLLLGADLLGAKTLQYFGWALLIGLVSGAYSSIFVASPIVAMLKERETRYRNIREKLALRGLDRQLFSAAALAEGVLGGDVSGGAATTRRRRAGAPGTTTDGRIRPGSGAKAAASRAAAPVSRPGANAVRRPASRSRRKGRSR